MSHFVTPTATFQVFDTEKINTILITFH